MANIATSYDEVPYASYPFAQSHPTRLAVIGTLFGMQPPVVETCRLLELGCAGGGNLVPMAVEMPRSSLLGIDLSTRQIDAGRTAIASLGLKNIELRAQSILDFDERDGEFDYIISHGVWSWVPPEVQAKMFDICRRQLKPQGIAYISYNTYPGWHTRGTVRDMMLFHSRKFDTPAKRIAHGRALLDFLVRSLPEQDHPYAMLLRNEFEALKDKSDVYLLHEHLEPFNQPVYFYQFDEQARAHGLQFLGEAHLASMTSEGFASDVETILRQLSANVVEMEQYYDFLRNRSFRQTLLCRSNLTLDRRPDRARLSKLLLTAKVTPQNELRLEYGHEAVFASPAGRLSTSDPLVKAMLLVLSESFPKVWRFEDAEQAARARLSAADLQQSNENAFASNILQMYLRGFVVLHAYMPPHADHLEERPKASPLARWQAEAGNITTTLSHEIVRIMDLERQVLLLCDGRRDRQQILVEMVALLKNGGIILPPEPREYGSPERLLDGALRWLLEQSMLIRGEAA